MDDVELNKAGLLAGYSTTLDEESVWEARERPIKKVNITQQIRHLTCLMVRAEEEEKAGMVLYYQVMIEEHIDRANQQVVVS